jgi:choline dehydrogenase-like flavoprotein
VYTRVVGEEFARLGMGEVAAEEWLEGREDWREFVGDQYHHMGTARMGDSAERGVVDRECRVYGVDNLYIASSAVFPTGGQAGPTLTIIAMALRMAEGFRR